MRVFHHKSKVRLSREGNYCKNQFSYVSSDPKLRLWGSAHIKLLR